MCACTKAFAQVRDSLSRTLNTEIHEALTILELNKARIKDKRSPSGKQSGSSTSSVYSSCVSDES